MTAIAAHAAPHPSHLNDAGAVNMNAVAVQIIPAITRNTATTDFRKNGSI
jgi:hypothetical protein